MIYKILVTNHIQETLALELANPWGSGIVVKDISGLGSAKADINYTDIPSYDGGIFNSSRLNARSVTLTFAPIGASSVETARQTLLQYFPVKKEILLEFITDNRDCYLSGYVESFDSEIFNSQETVVVNLLCMDPYFHKMNDETVVITGIDPAFEFPFSNESVTESLIEFSTLASGQRRTIVNAGTVDAGVICQIDILGSVGDITVYHVGTLQAIKILASKVTAKLGSALQLGDQIEFSTIKGNKYVRVLRNGVYTNIINALDSSSDWFVLSQGSNTIAYNATTGSDNILVTISYNAAYGGL